jgi:hypothetical protein
VELYVAPGFAFAVVYHVTDEWADNGPNSLKELIEEEMEGEFKLVSSSDIKVDGEKGKVAEAQGEIDDEGVSLLMAIIEYDDYVMHFAGISPTDDRASNRKIFDYMLKSIEFIRDWPLGNPIHGRVTPLPRSFRCPFPAARTTDQSHSMRIMTLPAGSGQMTRLSSFSQSPLARGRCLAGRRGRTACRA